MSVYTNSLTASRRRLARLRCLQDCIDCFKHGKPLPRPLCYVPSVKQYLIKADMDYCLFDTPKQERVCQKGKFKAGTKLKATGEEMSNLYGQWVHIVEVWEKDSTEPLEDTSGWMLLYDNQPNLSTSSVTDQESLVDVAAKEKKENDNMSPVKKLLANDQIPELSNWEEVVEFEYSLIRHFNIPTYKVVPPLEEAVEKMSMPQLNWSLEHDEDLAQYLGNQASSENDHLGNMKHYVESIDVSTSCEDGGQENLTDGDSDTYWESDGHQGQHWIKLHMKKGVLIRKLELTIDPDDDNYMPMHIVIMGGEGESLTKLNEVRLEEHQPSYGVYDLTVLEEQNEFYKTIEIKIKECKDDGIDTRIHGIKIKSMKEQEFGISMNSFTAENLVRYPKLEPFSQACLYYRALVLQRFMILFDSLLPYMVPAWEHTVRSYSTIEIIRQLLPLSKRRLMLIETFLRKTETARVVRIPKLYINRRAAAEHKSDPSADPEYKNSVFSQIYEGLKPRDRHEQPLEYRWHSRYEQWWECKFLSEGIIDQGGGFRDSLSDLAEELCPSAADSLIPLPFFISSPNQTQGDSNINRDAYIPNPNCKEFAKYEWIGKLMGACLRGKENLVLLLPPFFWKKLVGERVTWSRDYSTVDQAEVRILENMENMDEEEFEAYFESVRTWTTVLSNGQVVALSPDIPADETVQYEDRQRYCQLVQAARMSESDAQINAIRKGLLQVVPQAVLDLLTWQELERRICGDPEISLEALKRTTRYEDLDESDIRVKYLWEALSNFMNEDRSRFLRFVTGRRRLPTPLFVCPGKGGLEPLVDALPESSTCSNALYLPHYSSALIAEEKLRYAVYNCIAIDTDMSPWDE